MINRKEPELEPESQFVISAPAPEGYLISAPRLRLEISAGKNIYSRESGTIFFFSLDLTPFFISSRYFQKLLDLKAHLLFGRDFCLVSPPSLP